MKQKKILIGCCSVLSCLILFGCATEMNHTATSSDGVKISFDVQGQGKPAIIFIHGWANNRSIWDAQVSHFSKKYKVVNIDLPGFGQSGNNRQEWTIAAFGKDVVAVMEKLNIEKVILVGFSLGASISIEAANITPERIAGVVLVDDLQNVEEKYPPPVVSYMDSLYIDLVINPTVEKLVNYGFIKNNPEESFARVLPMLKDAPRPGWRESILGYMEWINESCEESLKKCQVPIRAINADMIPTNVEAFRKLVPSFQADIVPDVGHVIMWDAEEEFNRLLEKNIQAFVNQ